MWFTAKTVQKWSLDTGAQPVSLLFLWLFSNEHAKINVIKWEEAFPWSHVHWYINRKVCWSPLSLSSTENLTVKQNTCSDAARALTQQPHIRTCCNATMSVQKRSFSSSELKIVHSLPFVAAYRAARQSSFKMMDYEEQRENVRIINRAE